jgi:peroxiredoxin
VRAYQAVLPDLKQVGASLVAISPEKTDNSLTFKEKNELEFEVLTDPGNDVARSFGLSFRLDDAAKAVFLETFSLDLAERNGDGSWELPIPATYVIAPDGRIEFAFVDADYTKRAEPETILEAVQSLV